VRRASLGCLGSLLLGCASYGPLSEASGGGYTDRLLSPGIHEVVFRGTLSREQIDDLALLRAAQLTLEQGYGYFDMDPIWLATSETRTRYVIELSDGQPSADYDAAEVQAMLLEKYPSLGIPVVAREPEPAADRCR
jgi:hypothetical protein